MGTNLASEPADWPAFCCAVLRDERGRYLLERRPASALAAAGKLTCFGGKREPGESPETCIRRELWEELKWKPSEGGLERCVTLLWTGPERVFAGRKVMTGGVLAWYYKGAAPAEEKAKCVLPGHTAVWVLANQMGRAELSDWHRTALQAEKEGFKTTSVAK
jgi:8-oxo-dGTP pyrophosphatase MutT (NUDIX family)